MPNWQINASNVDDEFIDPLRCFLRFYFFSFSLPFSQRKWCIDSKIDEDILDSSPQAIICVQWKFLVSRHTTFLRYKIMDSTCSRTLEVEITVWNTGQIYAMPMLHGVHIVQSTLFVRETMDRCRLILIWFTSADFEARLVSSSTRYDYRSFLLHETYTLEMSPGRNGRNTRERTQSWSEIKCWQTVIISLPVHCAIGEREWNVAGHCGCWIDWIRIRNARHRNILNRNNQQSLFNFDSVHSVAFRATFSHFFYVPICRTFPAIISIRMNSCATRY